MRVLLSVVAHRNWNMLQLDINNTFLNGHLIKEIYMDMSLGYPVKNDNMVCKLTKSLYGLRQASRQWFHKFSTTFLDQGFQQCHADHSLFTRRSGATLVTLLVYVDEIIVAGPDQKLIAEIQLMLAKHFKIKVIGDLKYFLGLEIAKSPRGIHLCQHKYTLQLLTDTDFAASKPQSVPMDPNSQARKYLRSPITLILKCLESTCWVSAINF